MIWTTVTIIIIIGFIFMIKLINQPPKSWQQQNFCKDCHEQTNYINYCPLCGHTASHSMYKFYETKIVRWVKNAPWWKFWGKQGHYEFKE